LKNVYLLEEFLNSTLYFCVWQIIKLSSSANHLSCIQNKADEYAAMIMEELDPDHMGYIMVNFLDHGLKLNRCFLLNTASICNFCGEFKTDGESKEIASASGNKICKHRY